MRRFFTALVASGVLAACGGRTPLELPQHKLGVHADMSVSALRAARPDARFVPYLGWMDSLSSDPHFTRAQFEVYSSPPEKVTPPGGRLWAVRYFGRSTAGNASIRSELDDSFGEPTILGCVATVEGQYFSIASWPSESLNVVGITRVDSVGVENGPMSVQLAQRSVPLDKLTRLHEPPGACPAPGLGNRN